MMEYDALYVQLMNSIKEKMLRGEYQIGDKLDSERVMAQQYGINRLTVRKALTMLEDQGFVKAQRGPHTAGSVFPERCKSEYAHPPVRLPLFPKSHLLSQTARRRHPDQEISRMQTGI